MIAARKTQKRKGGAFKALGSDGGKVAVRTPNVPDYTRRVDAAKYQAMRRIVLGVMPRKAPGITQSEMMAALVKISPAETFPGRTCRWWGKCVQLDLEARGLLVREPTRPLRWRRKGRRSAEVGKHP